MEHNYTIVFCTQRQEQEERLQKWSERLTGDLDKLNNLVTQYSSQQQQNLTSLQEHVNNTNTEYNNRKKVRNL